MLAMLFLVLFATLAVGFYASTDMSSQVSANDEHVSRSFVAAESGLEYMKYQLAHVHIPPTTTQVDQVTTQLFSDLQNAMESTGNLGSLTLAKSGYVISIPGDPNGRIKLDPSGNAAFRATVTVWPAAIVVKTDGYYGGIAVSSALARSRWTSRARSTSPTSSAMLWRPRDRSS